MNQQCSTSPHLFDPRFHAVWGVLWGGGDGDNKPFRLGTCEDFLACKRATLGMKHGGGSHALEWIYQPNRIVCLNFHFDHERFHFLLHPPETISRQAMKTPMASIATGVLVESYRAAAPSQAEASGWRRFPFYLQWSIGPCYESCLRPSLGPQYWDVLDNLFFSWTSSPSIIIASISSCFHWLSSVSVRICEVCIWAGVRHLDHWQFRWQVVLPNGELLCHGRPGEVENELSESDRGFFKVFNSPLWVVKFKAFWHQKTLAGKVMSLHKFSLFCQNRFHEERCSEMLDFQISESLVGHPSKQRLRHSWKSLTMQRALGAWGQVTYVFGAPVFSAGNLCHFPKTCPHPPRKNKKTPKIIR